MAAAYTSATLFVSPEPGASSIVVPLDALAAGSTDADTPPDLLQWSWRVDVRLAPGIAVDPLQGSSAALLVQLTNASSPVTGVIIALTGWAPGVIAPLLDYLFVVTLLLSDGCTSDESSVTLSLVCGASLAITTGPPVLQVRIMRLCMC